MAQNDLAGLLTGVSQQRRNPLNPMSSNLTPDQQWMAMGAQNVGVMQSGMRGLMGTPSVDEQRAELKSLMAGLDPRKTKDAEKLIKIMMATGDRAGAAKLAATLEARALEKKQRSGLITQARTLGLDQTAQVLADGGDPEVATKQILEAEERIAVSKRGRKGRADVARSRGADKIVIDSILKGDYDDVSDTLFLDRIKGQKAQLKTFKITNQNGTTTNKPFRVNEAGQVWDDTEERWVDPNDLGLEQAPQVTQALSAADDVTKKLTGGFVDNFLELNDLGNTALKILDVNAASGTDLDKLYTGKLAPLQLAIMDLGKTFGVISPEQTNRVVATQTFMINRAKQVLPLIKALGSGTAISDKDRQFISKIVAADKEGIELDIASIKNIIRLENEYSRKAINKSNAALDQLNKIKGTNLDPAMVEGLYITAPSAGSPSEDGYSANVESILERVRARNARNGGPL